MAEQDSDVGSQATTPVKRPQILASTSSAYELDLPAVPDPSHLEDLFPNQRRSHPSILGLKANSPIYGNVEKSLSACAPPVTTPDLELSIIHEAGSSPSVTDEDDEDMENIQVYGNVTSLHNGQKKNQDIQTSKPYTSLRRSRVNEDSVYDIPVSDTSSTQLLTATERSHARARDDRISSGPSTEQDSSESNQRSTSYFLVNDSAPSNHNQGKSTNSSPGSRRWAKWTAQRGNKGKREGRSGRTFRNTFRHMRAVGMSDSLCWNGPHRHAKMFFTFLAVITAILAMALVGLIVAALSWGLLQHKATMIQDNFNGFRTQVQYCRVGRNWTALPINSNTMPLTIPINDSSLRNVSLDLLGTSQDISFDNMEPTPKQLLVYIVVQTSDDAGSGRTMEPSGSYINVGIWTRRDLDRSFRQYLCVLNDDSLQVVSRSFWFPREDTDGMLFFNAQLLRAHSGEKMRPLDVSLYLSGYC